MYLTRVARLAAAGMLAAAVAVTVSQPATAETAAERAPVPAELGNAIQRDLGMTVEQAAERFAVQQRAAATERQLRAELGNAFGGAWFDASAGKLVVGVTDRTAASKVHAAGAIARVVEHSAAKLADLKSTLDSRVASMPESVTGWMVDHVTNSVVVSTTGSPAAAARWADSGLVRVQPVEQAPRLHWNLIGGQAITTGGSRCSLGFNARTSSYRYVITAGHCTDIGGTWYGTGGVIGPVAGSSFPGNDFGAIYVSSSSARSTPYVDRYSSGSDVIVAGTNNVPVGGTVCRSGSTTGWHCGTVLQRNATVCYAQGCVYQTIRTDVCSEPGDSGGSLVSVPNWNNRVQAQGLTSGGSGNCSRGGITYFQPIKEVLNVWNLTIYTG